MANSSFLHLGQYSCSHITREIKKGPEATHSSDKFMSDREQQYLGQYVYNVGVMKTSFFAVYLGAIFPSLLMF